MYSVKRKDSKAYINLLQLIVKLIPFKCLTDLLNSVQLLLSPTIKIIVLSLYRMPQKMPQRIPQRMPQRMPQRILQKMPQRRTIINVPQKATTTLIQLQQMCRNYDAVEVARRDYKIANILLILKSNLLLLLRVKSSY